MRVRHDDDLSGTVSNVVDFVRRGECIEDRADFATVSCVDNADCVGEAALCFMDGGAREHEAYETFGNLECETEADVPFHRVGAVAFGGSDGEVEACVVRLSVARDYCLGVEFFNFNFHLYCSFYCVELNVVVLVECF